MTNHMNLTPDERMVAFAPEEPSQLPPVGHRRCPECQGWYLVGRPTSNHGRSCTRRPPRWSDLDPTEADYRAAAERLQGAAAEFHGIEINDTAARDLAATVLDGRVRPAPALAPIEALIGASCAICGDPTHTTERHEATLDDDF